MVRLQPMLLSVLDAQARDLGMTRPEALRSAFQEWAAAQGLIEEENTLSDKPVVIRVEKSDLDALTAFAANHDMTYVDAVSVAIQEFLERQEEE
jgi:hypothetical protein